MYILRHMYILIYILIYTCNLVKYIYTHIYMLFKKLANLLVLCVIFSKV